MTELMSLTHKVALITGASSGIGKATAILFARLGSRLALVARDEQRLIETVAECKAVNHTQHPPDKEPYIYVTADLLDPIQIEAAFSKTMAHFNQLNILVNNAGFMPQDNIETVTMQNFEQTMKVNLYSAVLLTHLAVPALTATKGTVVNVSSVCGTRSFPNVLSYCVSKAGLDQFTKCAALGKLHLFSSYVWIIFVEVICLFLMFNVPQ
ncbi:uncharacterized protein DEA37_0010959 [Paragonimus westermani]|uniref:Uncharacterized protein n=1 Tax=Paragonimus westermani TaxID=34504 RepID=A0A5J4N8U9_9TREM|nr:uncharacterized protein DEA37_0010959 [Paragonimus westermani]